MLDLAQILKKIENFPLVNTAVYNSNGNVVVKFDELEEKDLRNHSIDRVVTKIEQLFEENKLR